MYLHNEEGLVFGSSMGMIPNCGHEAIFDVGAKIDCRCGVNTNRSVLAVSKRLV